MTRHGSRRTLLLSTLALGALILSGCLIRPTSPNTVSSTVVSQPAPVVVQQPAPVVVQQPAPVVVQQRPVIVQQPIVIRQPSPVLHPVRVSVPARVSAVPASVANGVVSYPHQRVRYPLTLTYTRTLRIYVDGHGLDPTVAIYNQYGSRIAFNDDGGSGLDSQIVQTLPAGSYHIEVAGYSSSTGSYTLTIN